MLGRVKNIVSSYWRSPNPPDSVQLQSDACLTLPLSELLYLAEHNRTFRENILNAPFLKQYCNRHKIPLIFKVQPHVAIQGEVHGDAEAKQQEYTPAAGVVRTEILDSLYHYEEALHARARMASYSGYKDESSRAVYEMNRELYLNHLIRAAGKENLLAFYLLKYEILSNDLPRLSWTSWVEEFNKIRSELEWAYESFETAALLYMAELIYRFANDFLNQLNLARIEGEKEYVNKPHDHGMFVCLLATSYDYLRECIDKAYTYLNQFEDEKNLLDTFTQQSMSYFTHGMSGRTSSETIAVLKANLEKLAKACRESSRYTDQVNYLKRPGAKGVKNLLGSPLRVDVNPGHIPWPSQQPGFLAPSTRLFDPRTPPPVPPRSDLKPPSPTAARPAN